MEESRQIVSEKRSVPLVCCVIMNRMVHTLVAEMQRVAKSKLKLLKLV